MPSTKGLVATALSFFSTHCSSRSKASELLSSGTFIVAPAATIFRALALRSPARDQEGLSRATSKMAELREKYEAEMRAWQADAEREFKAKYGAGGV